MKLLLKDFQQDAVEALHDCVDDARKRAGQGKLEAITLAAPTGSGKTVILTRLIELTLRGDETHNPDPGAVFLWLTDQPETEYTDPRQDDRDFRCALVCQFGGNSSRF